MPTATATQSWQTVTLSGNEKWQARGPVMVTADSGESTSSDGSVGLLMEQGEVLDFVSGDTVIYKAAGTNTTIWREPRA